MENIRKGKVIPINHCNSCGKTLKLEWKFCPYCKNEAKIETLKCFSCGQDLKTNWNYCPNCKSEIKAELNDRLRTDSCNEWLKDILKK